MNSKTLLLPLVCMVLAACARAPQQPSTGTSAPISSEQQKAIDSFLNPLPLEQARQADPAFARAEQAASASILKAPATNSLNLRATASVTATNAASATPILHPHQAEEEWLKDPDARRRRDEAFRTLQQNRTP